MSITPEQVTAAFQVTGLRSVGDITYTRFTDTAVAPIPLIVSNSSTVFGIRFFPTASAGILFKTEDDTLVDKNAQITLPRVSGSNITGIKLFAVINTDGFDDGLLTSKTYDIGFNMVAITSSAQSSTDTLVPSGETDQPCTPEGASPILYPCCSGLEPVTEPPTLLPVCRTAVPQTPPSTPLATPPTTGGRTVPSNNDDDIDNRGQSGGTARRPQPSVPTIGPADQ